MLLPRGTRTHEAADAAAARGQVSWCHGLMAVGLGCRLLIPDLLGLGGREWRWQRPMDDRTADYIVRCVRPLADPMYCLRNAGEGCGDMWGERSA